MVGAWHEPVAGIASHIEDSTWSALWRDMNSEMALLSFQAELGEFGQCLPSSNALSVMGLVCRVGLRDPAGCVV